MMDAFSLQTLPEDEIARPLQLFCNRQRTYLNGHTKHVWSHAFRFDVDLERAFMNCTLVMNTTPDDLAFTCYYAFLFKLTNGERNLCVERNIHHSIRLTPFRLQIDPNSSFSELLIQVIDIVPLPSTVSHDMITHTPPCSGIFFDFHTITHVEPENTKMHSNRSNGEMSHKAMLSYQTNGVIVERQSTYDLSLTINYNADASTLTCTLDGSCDLFDQKTLQDLSHRFHTLSRQLFLSSSFDLKRQPLYQLSILLPFEQHMLQQFNNHLPPSTSVTSCIHQGFVQQTIDHPNKIAITLDHQSLTYTQLLLRIQHLALVLINEKNVQPGDIVCQCIDRSIDMIVGIMSIMMCGGVYAPLSPYDPLDRLESLVHQVNAKLVLVNQLTPSHVYRLNIPVVNIDETSNGNNHPLNDAQVQQLSQVRVTPDSISHLVFTSGSTGVPKAVQLRHRNFMSYIDAHLIRKNDIILQLASSSFDVHLDEIISALARGAHLILLKSGGHLDFDYMTKVICEKHVTFVAPVPSWMDALATFLNDNQHARNRVKQVHWWYLGGEQLLSSVVRRFLPFVGDECHILNSYGPAEITETATCYEVRRDDLSNSITAIPIGRPLAGYRVYLVDEYRQLVVPGQQGEIVIGGVGVFAGYYGRSDLTEEVLINVNDDRCYASGDFGRLDPKSGELLFIGRRDFQVKLRGQRIELTQIERAVLEGSSLILNCIVVKFEYHEHEHLLAYVESSSSSVKEEELRKQCLLRLPSYMVPSIFMILEHFPLTRNGKIDRKALPPPDLVTFTGRPKEYNKPSTPMELRVHNLWCEVLHIDLISINTSFFALHGTSLLFMKLYNLYQIEFGIAPDIVACLRQASIIEHAQLLNEAIISTTRVYYQPWTCLRLDQAEASFAQSRIFLDEQIRFRCSSEKTVAIYNLPLLCHLSKCSVSINYLRQALQRITEKHTILRTCIRLDPVSGNLIQHVKPNDIHDWFDFDVSVIDNDNTLESIFNDEVTNPAHFNLQEGRVFRCHIVHRRPSTMIEDGILPVGDWIIFNFHHIAFDGESEQIFLDDLHEFYNHEQPLRVKNEETTLQYIDYSIHERQIDMNTAKLYWCTAFKDYNIEKSMALPVDRTSPPNGVYTGQGYTVKINFTNQVVKQLVDYASQLNVTLYQVCLTIYYIFLFKLTGGREDLVVGIVQANRYRPELRRMLGMFVNTLPMRVRVDWQDTFNELLHKVSNMIFEAQPHSNLPYQNIIEQLPMRRHNEKNLIQAMFTLDENQTMLERSKYELVFEQYSTFCLDNDVIQIGAPTSAAAMFDMTLSMDYMADKQSLRANMTASSDLFDSNTVVNIARRFYLVVEQLMSVISTAKQSICDLSLLLPEEIAEDMLYLRSDSIIIGNSIEGRASFSQTRIWLDEQTNCDSQSGVNSMPYLYQIMEGSLSIEHLRRALQLVVLTHSSLRTSSFFDTGTDCLMQRVIQLKDNEEDLFTFVESTFKMDTDLRTLMFNEFYNVSNFDIINGRVFYVHVFRREHGNKKLLQRGDFLLFNFHQSICDLQSFNIFCRDLSRAYECETALSCDANKFRYIDYAIAEQNISMKEAYAFWHEIMFEYAWNHRIALPADRQRNTHARRSGRAYTTSFTFNHDEGKAFINYATATNVALLPIFLTCYYAFLFKLTNKETDLCVGMNVNSRYKPEHDAIIGNFMNLIPLRFQLEPLESFEYSLHRIVKLCQQSFRYAHLPYQYILKEFGLPLATFLQISFDFQTDSSDKNTLKPVKFSDPNQENATHISINHNSCVHDVVVSKFDLSLTINYNSDASTLTCTLDGSCDLFDQKTLQDLSHRFHTLSRQLFLSSSFDLKRQPLYELSILLPFEQHTLQQFNNHLSPSTNVTSCIHQAFVQQTINHPNKIAITLDHQSLTYTQLLVQIQHLALVLINEKNVQPGDIVCQCIDRSIDMIVGIMSIMMCGGVYAPLSPYDPLDRLESLVHQVNAKLVLVNQLTPSHVHRLNIPIVNIDDTNNGNNHPLNDAQLQQLSQVRVTPDSISHLVFTSGSTGVPKAVQLRHRNFMSYIDAHLIRKNDIILQLASSSFDVHLDEIISALVRGAHLILLKSGGHLDFDYMTKVICEKHVTFVAPVPSWMDALATFLNDNHHAGNRVKQVHWWYLGGEQLLSSVVRRFLPFVGDECHILNSYGPAEITETATCYEVRRDDLSNSATAIPIGRPLAGYRVYLVDEYRQLVVPGQQGEIVIGGVGVFAGYYGRSDLTDEVLINVNDDRCYASGDFGRLDPKSKELLFIGRRDFQVKLRGQRIEISAIESTILEASSDIMNCVVVKEGSDNDSYLSAYIKIKKNQEKNNVRDKLIEICRSHLPSYMIPTKWVFVADFPLNQNGKIDRSKLIKDYETERVELQHPPIKSLSPLEISIKDIFVRAFHLKRNPDVKIPFGQLGGTSLGAMHALIIIREEIYEKMEISVLFDNPSIQQLAATLEPLVTTDESIQDKREDDEDFSIRPSSSWLIETLGILLLAWQWLWPIYVASKLKFNFLLILLVPMIHLLQYPVFMKLLGGPFPRGRDALYSWRYYRIWFLRRQWSLNTYWLSQLLGTPIYNAYLRLCGARIGGGTHIYTSHIDAPWLIEIGNNTYIAQEVILSSVTYHDCIYNLNEIRIGSSCSIATRCVLHDRVDMYDGVCVEPLTAVTGRIFGNTNETKLSYDSYCSQATFQLVAGLMIASMHILILKLSWVLVSGLSLCLSLAFCWLLWSILGAGMGLLLLRYIVGNVEENFSQSLNSWQFLRRFWLRHVVIRSFGPCFSTIFDGLNLVTPYVLHWLGATIENKNIEIVDFVPLLVVPSNLLAIESDVTMTSEICFCPYDVTIHGQCIVAGPIRIGRRSFLGNNCVMGSGVDVPEDTLIGSLTRVDTTTVIGKKNDILLGVPARSMPFILSDANPEQITVLAEQRIIHEFFENFQQILMKFAHLVFLCICIRWCLMMTSSIYQFLLMVPIFLFIYSFIVHAAYIHLMANTLNETSKNHSLDEISTSWRIVLAMALFSYYTKYIGSLLGGSQWLILVLRGFGSHIGEDVIIDDMNSLYDVHLITIGSHTRLSSMCQIQCHTFEQRRLKLRPVLIGPACIFKPMSFALPGGVFLGYNYLGPCSLTLPHEQFSAYTDWSGSPTKRIIVHHGVEPPHLILGERQSSIGSYNVIVGRTKDDILTLYFGENGWMGWQSALDSRRPYRPCDIYIRLFFTSFLCTPHAKRVLIIGLGGGIWPILIRHYYPLVIVDVVEIDETVITLANDHFGLAEQSTHNHFNIYADDGLHYVSETTHQYDIIFVDAFLEEAMPTLMNTRHFFLNLSRILNDGGCLATNSNLPTTDAFNRLEQALSSTFSINILLAHSNIIENACVIISGTQSSLTSIASITQAIQEAKRLEMDVRLEFSLARLISLAYRGRLTMTPANDCDSERT